MKRLLILLISLMIAAVVCGQEVLKRDLELRKTAPLLNLNGSGAVLQFYNGDVSLTQSSNLLTLSGGNFSLGANSLLGSGSIGATGSRLLKGWFTDLEITNSPTVNGVSIASIYAPLASPTFTGTVTGTFSGNLTGNVTGTSSLVTGFTRNSGTLTLSGGHGITFTTTGTTTVTLPTSGTLMTKAGGEAIESRVDSIVAVLSDTLNIETLLDIDLDTDTVADLSELRLKANIASPTFTGTVTMPTPFTLGATSVTASGAELNLLDGVTSIETYSTENYGTTGMGDVVLNIGATMTDPVITNAPRSTGTVVAGTGITAAMLSRFMYFNTASAIDITADPQIANGTSGQIITIIGSSDTNTLTLDDTDGLRLTGQCILGIGDNITLLYEGTIGDWIEISRSNN